MFLLLIKFKEKKGKMQTDRLTVRMVIGFLGLISVLSILVIGFLVYNDKDVTAILGLGSASLGGLAGILAKTGSVPDNGETGS